MPQGILTRKLDIVYTLWFIIHLVVMLCVDLVPLYPPALQPQPLVELRKWYITTYNDRFFIAPPAWFTTYAYMELFYHVPISLWAIGALLRDDPLVPLHLLIWALQTVLTTGTCIVDYMSWEGVTAEVKNGLHGLYVPYFVLSVLMGCDMFYRLQSRLLQQKSKAE